MTNPLVIRIVTMWHFKIGARLLFLSHPSVFKGQQKNAFKTIAYLKIPSVNHIPRGFYLNIFSLENLLACLSTRVDKLEGARVMGP